LRAGAFDRARELIERSLEAARRVDELEDQAQATACLGDLGFLAGEPDVARTAIERFVAMTDPLGALARAFAYGSLGRQRLLDGQAAEAIEALEFALTCCNEGNRG